MNVEFEQVEHRVGYKVDRAIGLLLDAEGELERAAGLVAGPEGDVREAVLGVGYLIASNISVRPPPGYSAAL